jgi:RNA polymerase sigma-70 factor (ECF subfamily)
MSSLTDGELIARVRQGEEAALEALYDRHAPRMLGLALRMVSARDVAEDVLQEAFVRVWERAESFDPVRGNFAAWLAAIVRNRCLDYFRKHGSAVLPRNDPDEISAPDPDGDTLGAVVARDQQMRLRQALTRLPDDQRQVIELAFFAGLTRREIAARLNCPPGTIHTRARLALDKLRDALREEA